MTDTLFLRDVLSTPTSLASTIEALDGQSDETAAALLARGARRFVGLGSGSSWFAAAAAASLHNALVAPSGTLALAAETADFDLYPLPLGPDDAVVGVSVSGEIVELLSLLSRLRGRHQLVGITNTSGTSLERLVDHVLIMHAGESQSPTTTKAFVTSMAALDLLWLSVLACQGVETTSLRADLRKLPDAVARSLEQARPQLSAAAGRLAACDHVYVLGAGPLYPLAQEIALAFKEVASVPAELVQTREMQHGTMSVVNGRTGVVVMNPPGPGRGAVAEIVEQCTRLGASVVEVGPASPGLHFDVPCHELLAPCVYVGPLFLLVGTLAVERGVDTDHPHWQAEYLRMTRSSGEPAQGQSLGRQCS
jgi:glutamine---fructose-6-phosphate transaminase (isomerizing)